jgi:hypothetical protein
MSDFLRVLQPFYIISFFSHTLNLNLRSVRRRRTIGALGQKTPRLRSGALRFEERPAKTGLEERVACGNA